jgi:hypothetical protein
MYACAVAWLVPVSPLVVVARLKLFDPRRQLAAWRCLGDTGGLASLTHTSKLLHRRQRADLLGMWSVKPACRRMAANGVPGRGFWIYGRPI